MAVFATVQPKVSLVPCNHYSDHSQSESLCYYFRKKNSFPSTHNVLVIPIHIKLLPSLVTMSSLLGRKSEFISNYVMMRINLSGRRQDYILITI